MEKKSKNKNVKQNDCMNAWLHDCIGLELELTLELGSLLCNPSSIFHLPS